MQIRAEMDTIVGSIYLWQALKAQWKWGNKSYDYVTLKRLKIDRDKGWHFNDYCREQQAKMAEVYYEDVLAATPPLAEDSDEHKAYAPFIKELRNGEL